MRLRVLIVEDSAVMRRVLRIVVEQDPELEVAGEASDGAEAVELAARPDVDVVMMDVNMPVMNGLEATKRIMESRPRPIVLVTASLDPADVRLSFEALAAGALALVEKPAAVGSPAFAAQAAHLVSVLKLMSGVKLVRRRALPPRPSVQRDNHRVAPLSVGVVAIAASTGGPAALLRLLGDLPWPLAVPVLVVQHLASGFHDGMASWLSGRAGHAVRVASEGDLAAAGVVLIAPADRHMTITRSGRVHLADSPPLGGHRPSATELFRSVAEVYRERAVAVVLTGMGDDGVAGLIDIQSHGGFVFAQDEASCVVYGMPKESAQRGLVDRVLPLNELGFAIERLVQRRNDTRAGRPGGDR